MGGMGGLTRQHPSGDGQGDRYARTFLRRGEPASPAIDPSTELGEHPAPVTLGLESASQRAGFCQFLPTGSEALTECFLKLHHGRLRRRQPVHAAPTQEEK